MKKITTLTIVCFSLCLTFSSCKKEHTVETEYFIKVLPFTNGMYYEWETIQKWIWDKAAQNPVFKSTASSKSKAKQMNDEKAMEYYGPVLTRIAENDWYALLKVELDFTVRIGRTGSANPPIIFEKKYVVKPCCP